MESALISEATKNGIFAILFVILFVWTMRENSKREAKSDMREQDYQEFIKKLQVDITCGISDSHRAITSIAGDVDGIAAKVHTVSEKLEIVDRKITEVDKKVSRIHDQIDVEDYR